MTTSMYYVGFRWIGGLWWCVFSVFKRRTSRRFLFEMYSGLGSELFVVATVVLLFVSFFILLVLTFVSGRTSALQSFSTLR